MLRAERRGCRFGLLLIMASIRQANAADLPAVLALLGDSGLPWQDIDAGRMKDYLVAWSGDALLGTVGVETYGTNSLLRSLAVRHDARSTGLGTALCAAMERQARRNGAAWLFLLTTTAERFFSRRGYHAMDRGAAPPAIQATAEFASLCPSRAVCMTLELDRQDTDEHQTL